jgi:predicted ATPase
MAVAVSSRFVGRGDELIRLLAALERAEDGQPAMVLLTGEAGIGKTRLVAELANNVRQRSVRILLGGCLQVGDVGLPYVPVIAALRGFAAEDDNDELAAAVKGLPGLGRLLPELVDQPTARVSLEQGLEQVQLFDAVSSLLIRLSQQAPVVFVLEDLHWADSSTRELVAYLQQTLRGGRVLLLATYRSDALHRSHPLRPWLAELSRRPQVQRIELAPFHQAELAQHLEAIRGARLSTDAVARILTRSQGNPFYAEELLAAGADRIEMPLPAVLAEALLDRIEALSDVAKQLLRVAAVAGRQVSHGLLSVVTGQPEPILELGLREAIDARILVVASGATYGFRHMLTQEALYGDLLPSERVRLHGTFATLLASYSNQDGREAAAAELAYHCLESRDLPGALAASVRAAADAEQVAAPAEALRHLTRAIQLWEQVPDAAVVAGSDRTALLLRAAAAASGSGDPERAAALTREAVADLDVEQHPELAATAYERFAEYLLETDEFHPEALAACQRAAELVPRDPPTPLRARITAALARALMRAERDEEAQRWCQEAVTVARAIHSPGEDGLSPGRWTPELCGRG